MRGSRDWLLALVGAIGLLAVLATTTLAEASTPLAAAEAGSSEAVPEPLVVRGAADASFSRTWSWTVKGSMAPDHQSVAGGEATFDHTIRLDHGDPVVGDLALSGTVTVRNPNDVAVDGVDLSVDLDAPGNCSVTDGEGLRVPAGETITRDFSCTPEGHEASTVTVRATWPAAGALDAGSADDAVTLDWSVERIDACATVTDSMVDHLRAHRCVGDDDLALTGAATISGTPGTCISHDDTVTLVTDDLARTTDDTTTATVCAGIAPAVRVTAEPAFARAWAWTVDKSAAQDRLEVRSGTTADAAWSLVVDATPIDAEWTVSGTISVKNPNDWQDLPVDVAVSLPGADCRIPDGDHVAVPASSRAEVAYVCALGAAATDVFVSATVTVTDGLTPTDSATATGSATFGAPSIETDICAVLSDSTLDDGAERDPLCTSDLPATIDHTTTAIGVPGTCTPIADTATLTLRDSATIIQDGATVDLCVLAVPALAVAADPSFTRTHAWSIVKSVDEQLVRQLGGTTTLPYRVTVAQTGFTDAGWQLRGTIDVTNPNDWTAASVSLTAAVDDGGTCDVTDGAAVELAAGASATRAVSCTWSNAPDPVAGVLTVTATPALAGDPTGSAETPFTFGAPTSIVGGTVTVEDVFAGGPTWTLGVLRASDEAPFTVATDDYARTVGVPASGCVTYTNVARIVETGQSAAQTTRICAAERTGAPTSGR